MYNWCIFEGMFTNFLLIYLFIKIFNSLFSLKIVPIKILNIHLLIYVALAWLNTIMSHDREGNLSKKYKFWSRKSIVWKWSISCFLCNLVCQKNMRLFKKHKIDWILQFSIHITLSSCAEIYIREALLKLFI